MSDKSGTGNSGLGLTAGEAVFIAALLIAVTFGAIKLVEGYGDEIETVASHVGKFAKEKSKRWLDF